MTGYVQLRQSLGLSEEQAAELVHVSPALRRCS